MKSQLSVMTPHMYRTGPLPCLRSSQDVMRRTAPKRNGSDSAVLGPVWRLTPEACVVSAGGRHASSLSPHLLSVYGVSPALKYGSTQHPHTHTHTYTLSPSLIPYNTLTKHTLPNAAQMTGPAERDRGRQRHPT